MSEYPILFSGEMVRAILAGTKTQTRRVIEHQPEFGAYVSLEGFDRICLVHEDWAGNGVGLQAFPYARKIGDRLWVREKCAIGFNDDSDLVVDYHADGKRRWFDVAPENEHYALRYINDDWRRPSIHMPRWASRILLEVAGVRAERLQAISEEDARAEGLASWPSEKVTGVVHYGITISDVWETDPRLAFKRLWDSINGNRPKLPTNIKSKRYERVKRWLDKHPATDWQSNPWVWVIEFKRVAS